MELIYEHPLIKTWFIYCIFFCWKVVPVIFNGSNSGKKVDIEDLHLIWRMMSIGGERNESKRFSLS